MKNIIAGSVVLLLPLLVCLQQQYEVPEELCK